MSSLFRWRVPIRWYIIALGLPTVAAILATTVVWLVVRDGLEIEPESALTLLNTLVLFFLVVLGEEVGWRGYALPRLQQRHGALVASLILELVWAVWHLPAFWVSGIFKTTYEVLLAFAVFFP